jgi:Family of unknown function (DUF6049)
VKFLRILLPAGTLLVSAALAVPGVSTSLDDARTVSHNRSDSVGIVIDDVTPAAPKPTSKHEPLDVTLTLTNKSGTELKGVRIVGERGDPIGTQEALDKALESAEPPASPGLRIPSDPKLVVDLPIGGSQTVTFETTTSTIDDNKGICICATADQPLIYPLFFSAHTTGAGGVDQRLGVAATYLPSFAEARAPLDVTWIWPLLDAPHRLNDDTVFTDDLLASEVGLSGRLDRALQVVEDAGRTVPITVLVDPELLDELEVMADATNPYMVEVDGKPTPGTGQTAAKQWLDRFATMLTTEPDVQVQLTPYGDPDVESLSTNGLGWSHDMPDEMKSRVVEALAGRSIDATLAWPSSGSISSPTLTTLATSGVSTVVLNSRAVDTGSGSTVAPGLARLEVARHDDVAAALLSPAIEKYVTPAVTIGGQPPTTLPQILAELAVRVAGEPDVEHAVTLAPPRYVNPDVDAAVRTIKETSQSTFARPISLSTAVSGSLIPTGASHLAPVPASAPGLPLGTIDAVENAIEAVPKVSSLLDTEHDAAAKAFIDSLPAAIQRAESSAWAEPSAEADGTRFAIALQDRIDAVVYGVRIVAKPSGSYTLASDTSPLPITVENTLPYQVLIKVGITTVPSGLAGFDTKAMPARPVAAHQKATVNVSTSIDRSGRIRIRAVVLTPTNTEVGHSVTLVVRSTALGLIGVVITIVAGVVLALALLVRFARRFRDRRRAIPAPVGEPTPQPEPIP